MERRGLKTTSQTTISKNEYEILSPLFLKFVGFCMSIYLYVLCLQLFIVNYGYIKQDSFLYPQINVYLIWAIISSAFILCVFFSSFIFMKVDNSKVYLFNMYMLCCIKCVILLYILITYAEDINNTYMMMRIVLCFGFLFIFLEFLHAQTSKNSFRDKCILAGVMGITSCILPLMLTIGYCFFWIFYLLYALYIFILSLQGKEAKTSILSQLLFIAFLLLLSALVVPNIGSINNYTSVHIMFLFLEIFAVFSCTQLIPSKSDQTTINITRNSLHKLTPLALFRCNHVKRGVIYRNDLRTEALPMIKGIFMLFIRFTYFTLFAMSIATIWRG